MLGLKKQTINIYSRSIRDAHHLQGLYEEFSYLLDEEKVVKDFLAKTHVLSEYVTRDFPLFSCSYYAFSDVIMTTHSSLLYLGIHQGCYHVNP